MRTDTLILSSLSTSWKRVSSDIDAPTGATTYTLELISSSGTTGDSVYVDEIVVANAEE